jgi:hypothetical protein
MTKIEKLNSQLVVAKNEIEHYKKIYLSKKKELIEIENSLVEARENERHIQYQIDEYKNTFEIEHSLDDERLAEIEAYRQRMPEMMEKIKDEPIIPIVWSGTLGTMKEKK